MSKRAIIDDDKLTQKEVLERGLDRLVEQIRILIDAGHSFKDILAKLDVKLSINLYASIRSQLKDGSYCVVCGQKFIKADAEERISRLISG